MQTQDSIQLIVFSNGSKSKTKWKTQDSEGGFKISHTAAFLDHLQILITYSQDMRYLKIHLFTMATVLFCCNCNKKTEPCLVFKYKIKADFTIQPYKREYNVGDTILVSLSIPIISNDIISGIQIDINKIDKILIVFGTGRFNKPPIHLEDGTRFFKKSLLTGTYDRPISENSPEHRYIRMKKESVRFIATFSLIPIEKGIYDTGFMNDLLDQQCWGSFESNNISGDQNLDLITEVTTIPITFNSATYVFKVL